MKLAVPQREREREERVMQLGSLPRDQNGCLNKVQSVEEVLVVQLRRISIGLQPCASTLDRAMSKATASNEEHSDKLCTRMLMYRKAIQMTQNS